MRDDDISKSIDFHAHLCARIEKWLEGAGHDHPYAHLVGHAPDLLTLLTSLSLDPSVSAERKAHLAEAITYFIAPTDLLPESQVGPAGYVDDVALAAYVSHQIAQEQGEDVLSRHWRGSGNGLSTIESILGDAEGAVGQSLWRRLTKRF